MKSLLTILESVNQLKLVLRHNYADVTRQENSTEHSWSVAMYCWILADDLETEFKAKLDINKMIKMALMHDLVEVKSGDASVWDKEKRKSNEILDQKLSSSVFKEFTPDISKEFQELWREFQETSTLESKIVNGLDRFSAAIQRVITNQGWNEINATIDELDRIQLPKIEFSNTLMDLYSQLKQEALSKNLIKP